MRNTLLAAALLLPATALAQDGSNDLAMKSDTMIRDGEAVIVEPNGHVATLAPGSDRRKALETALAARGVEIDQPMMFALRNGKLWRMDVSSATEPGLTVK